MNLTGIISISGKPGLYRVVSQGKNTLIVEGIHDGKRFPAFSANKISALSDISIFTTDEDVPLGEVIQKIWDKENGGACIDAKEDANAMHNYFVAILPNYDKERVYNSDLKKLFAWYNLLQGSGTLAKIVEETAKAEAESKAAEAKPKKKAAAKDAVAEEEKPAKEAKAKKAPAKAAADKKEPKKKTAAPKAKAESKAKTSVRTTTVKRGA